MSRASLKRALELIVEKYDALGVCLCSMGEHCNRCDIDPDLRKAILIGKEALQNDGKLIKGVKHD